MKSPYDLIFDGLSKEKFISEYFGKEPLFISGEKRKFHSVFTLDAFNSIINSNQLIYPKVRVTDHRNTIHKYDLIEDKDRYINNVNNILEPRRLIAAIGRGGSLVFDKIQQHSADLEDFTDALAEDMNTHINVNAYYTSRNQKGVNPHFDRHDVLAVQIHGSKRWYYKKDQHLLSKSIRNQKVPDIDESFSGWESVLLNEGDILYCPRGVWHFTKTENLSSLHLAFGLYPLTLGDWLKKIQMKPEIAELLESYVLLPFMQRSGNTINKDVLDKFILAISQESSSAVSLDIEPREYMRLD